LIIKFHKQGHRLGQRGLSIFERSYLKHWPSPHTETTDCIHHKLRDQWSRSLTQENTMSTTDLSIDQLQAENAALRQRLATAEQRVQMLEAIIQYMPFSILIWQMENLDDPHSFRLVDMYTGSFPQTGDDLSGEIGRLFLDIFPNTPPELIQLYAHVVRTGQPQTVGEMTYADERFSEVHLSVEAIPLPQNGMCLMSQDIRERKHAEAALRQLIVQEETIRAQQATLAELSTPLIPLSTQVLVMPLIGSVDSRRAQQVIETLLQGISGSAARVAILDITGVPVVDTQVANALVRAAQAVKLLGAQVVLTGIRPEVAQTLVGLGTSLGEIVTCSSLQSGIAYATTQNIN
jgi:anti-anti-sigma regulatory factor